MNVHAFNVLNFDHLTWEAMRIVSVYHCRVAVCPQVKSHMLKAGLLTSKAGSARELRASRALGARRIATQKDIMKQK